jgi:hypothetical protein
MSAKGVWPCQTGKRVSVRRCHHVRVDGLNKRPRDLELHRQVFTRAPIVLMCGFIVGRCADKTIDLESNPNRILLQDIEGKMID